MRFRRSELERQRRAPGRARPTAPGEQPPLPQPEPGEPRLADPGVSDLSGRDYAAILVRAVREAVADRITDAAAALAYYSFLAIPAALLVSVGIFGAVAGPDAVQTMMDRLRGIAPAEAIELLEESMTRVTENPRGGVVMIALGGALAVWSLTVAMNALMRALNVAYERTETRGIVRRLLTSMAMVLFAALAFLLAFGLLVLGPHLSRWVGEAVGLEDVFGWIWWIAQWPVLVGGLLLAFAGILYLGPNVKHPRWRFLSFGSLVAVVVWLAASGGFAFYVSRFASYNKTWGSLSAVIVMLTWLWLTALALLLGAEINAEAERSRELRRGDRAERELQAPSKG